MRYEPMSERNIYRANNHGFCLGGCLLLLTVGALIAGTVLWGGVSAYQGICCANARAASILGDVQRIIGLELLLNGTLDEVDNYDKYLAPGAKSVLHEKRY